MKERLAQGYRVCSISKDVVSDQAPTLAPVNGEASASLIFSRRRTPLGTTLADRLGRWRDSCD